MEIDSRVVVNNFATTLFQYVIKNMESILLTKTTAAQNEVALSYHSVRGLYFLAVVFVSNLLRIQGTVQLHGIFSGIYTFSVHCTHSALYIVYTIAYSVYNIHYTHSLVIVCKLYNRLTIIKKFWSSANTNLRLNFNHGAAFSFIDFSSLTICVNL